MKFFAFVLLIAAPPAAADEHQDMTVLARNCLSDQDPGSCIGIAASVCMETKADGQTTFGMMSCVLAERDGWDVLLNEEYASARAFARRMDEGDAELFPEYAVRADQVRDAQRAWIAFRDANCAMEYGLWGAGSMRQIAGADCQLRMTAERTIALRQYQDDVT